jgi:hypothetical protein
MTSQESIGSPICQPGGILPLYIHLMRPQQTLGLSCRSTLCKYTLRIFIIDLEVWSLSLLDKEEKPRENEEIYLYKNY